MINKEFQAEKERKLSSADQKREKFQSGSSDMHLAYNQKNFPKMSPAAKGVHGDTEISVNSKGNDQGTNGEKKIQ